ncbi:hypothetical protein GGI02_002961 [Coemansia sp. RSA 2322]|uniref:Cytochrome c oxidase subunit 9, mitochondrial n=1 Tax=Coemansia thaxteri TaxID=2663907 RepID=A0A9W8BP17_9FUNG|nr:hypothetical protein H4R26_000322 [Coemansia thaxteri]KAJ2470389.1 hypothetical protein GGI02_002961 [Coemansia sp. RSA 2322]KAJ2487423.1 hypothetical protein EV174_000543 [Coemansia sp. RSA 2320]
MPTATPLKPIVGQLKRRVARDLVIGLGAGWVTATVYWHYFEKRMQRVDDYYAKHGRASERINLEAFNAMNASAKESQD